MGEKNGKKLTVAWTFEATLLHVKNNICLQYELVTFVCKKGSLNYIFQKYTGFYSLSPVKLLSLRQLSSLSICLFLGMYYTLSIKHSS